MHETYVNLKLIALSSLYVCMVNIKVKYNFVETPRKLTDPSLRIESFAIINVLYVVFPQNYILARSII